VTRIRSITIFSVPAGWSRRKLISGMEGDALSVLEALEDTDLDIWTTRISLPRLPPGIDPVSVASAVQELLDDHDITFAAPLHMDLRDERIWRLAEALQYEDVFASVRLAEADWADLAARLILRVSEADPFYAAKLGVELKGGIESSPYYPISVAAARGFGISLIYLDELSQGYRRGRLREAVSDVRRWSIGVGRSIERASGMRFLGVDMSPSPWMEDSVGGLLEELSGTRIPSPGTMYVIWRINEAVWDGMDDMSIGYNELMLPLAEDNVLKERGREGLRATDLLRMTAACVAGLDMVVLPGDIDAGILRGLILDQYAIREVKGRPMGTRLIVYPGASVGDVVPLGIFGDVPVIGI